MSMPVDQLKKLGSLKIHKSFGSVIPIEDRIILSITSTLGMYMTVGLKPSTYLESGYARYVKFSGIITPAGIVFSMGLF